MKQGEAETRWLLELCYRLPYQSWDKRHVTVLDQLVSFTGGDKRDRR